MIAGNLGHVNGLGDGGDWDQKLTQPHGPARRAAWRHSGVPALTKAERLEGLRR
jgi:hypothetical protein